MADLRDRIHNYEKVDVLLVFMRWFCIPLMGPNSAYISQSRNQKLPHTWKTIVRWGAWP